MRRSILAFQFALFAFSAFSQSVPFPTGPLDPNKLEPWGYEQKGTTWNTAPYLPFKYQGRHFRLMPPNGITYNSTAKTWTFPEPGKKYPLILFFHGRGEAGLDNNMQLLHGGEKHKLAVQNGSFPGFLLYPQSSTVDQVKAIVEKLLIDLPVDINRIYVHGLSNGGVDTWKFTINYPTLVAASFPMSAADDLAKTENLLYTPIRLAQGGLDSNPGAWWTQTIVDWFNTNGGHLEYFYLPTVGHGTWNHMYNRADFFSWFLLHKKNKIEVRFNRHEQCPEEITNVTMGFTPGFDDYEWLKDGVPFASGPSAYKITATQHGYYTGRILNRGVWSPWADSVQVKFKSTTITPPIQLTTLQSTVIPDINGNSTISLTLPEGYETYSYYKDGSETPFATTRTTSINTTGSYTAKIKEFGGCSSTISAPLVVYNANGSPKPDAISNLQAAATSKTQIRLTWENNNAPTVNESGFEIYRALNTTGPFTLITTTAQDVLLYNDINLPSNTVYFYRVRPVAATGAGTTSAIVSATTETDITPPTAPASLTVTSQSPTSIGLSWTASTDDVGVVGYDVYIRQDGQTNFIKAYSTTSTTQLVAQLTPNTLYNLIVKARDEEGNNSPASQQVVAPTILKGLAYSYYHGTWSVLPNFNSLTPVATGYLNNFSLTPKTQNDNIGFVYTGFIQIPTSGTYTFFTTSDDGSKLWVNNMSTALVNNDGLHGAVEASGSTYLNAGHYPIRVEFFENGGGESLQVRWQGPGISKQLIPDNRLIEGFTLPAAPSAPSGLQRTVLDFRSIRINWNNYTGTGTEIEIYRSAVNSNSWVIINTVPATTTTYTDTNLQSSTRYYYRLRAVNSGSASSFTSSVNGTTQALPPIPGSPGNLQIGGITVSSANLTWNDNSNNEDNFEVYKSTGNNGAYSKMASLPANTTQFTDNSLFAHTTYYYKIVSKNVSGLSAFSNEVQATTLNNSPVLSGARNITLRYDEVLSVPLTASDVDNDFLVIGGTDLPAFAQIFDDGSGNGILTLIPSGSDQGTYNGLELFAMDTYGGQHTVPFNIIVNDNHSPVITPPAAASLKETNILIVNANAADADSDPVTWSINNAPAFMNYVINGNSIEMNFHPGVNDSGNYSVTLTATDPDGASDTETFSVSVENYDPNFTMKANFRTWPEYNGPADWNNVGNSGTSLGVYPLNKEDGTSTGISLELVDEPLISGGGEWGKNKDNSGVAPGIYPDKVNKSYLFFFGDKVRTIRLSGLNPQGKYNLKFLSSNKTEAVNSPWLTKITISGQLQSINPLNNASSLIVFTGLSSNTAGEISALVQGPSNGYACINAIVIESYYEGNEVPAAPSNLEATIVSEAIQLTWVDNSDNEQTQELYRSTDNVNFTKIATLTKDEATYTDSNFTPAVTYYYKVRGVNGIGGSDYSNTGSVVAPNRTPAFVPVSSINMPEMVMQWIEITANDADNDALNFTLENEPPFMWTEYVSNNKLNLAFAPSEGDNGTYQFLLHCDDSRGARATATIDVTITSVSELEYRINFTGSSMGAAPWNNVTSYAANTVVANLKNSENVTTPVSLTLVNSWTALNTNGYTTGNNTGIYPDAVTVNSFYVGDNTARNMLISGLDPNKAYDFTFYASRMGVTDVRRTIYTIGAKSASLNASNNGSNVAKIIGVKPAANGQLTVSVAKESTSPIGYLNAMVIREYVLPPTIPDAPGTLTSQVMTRNSIKLNWQDLSLNETGFQIWRSNNDNSNFTLLTTVGAGVTSYTSAGLSMNSTYYYKVRAVNEIGPSPYSNESSGTTYEYSVSVNFYAINGGPTTWNNLNYLNTGEVATNLKDDLGNNTGISMTVAQAFAGTNPFGMNTGNESGVVPDKVMEGSWWIDKSGTAILRFGNLSFLKKYNFSFFGSRNATGDRTTIYIINGSSVSLNASSNTSNMVQIKDIEPEGDGTVTITITTTPSALFGYLNGLIIQAVPLGGGGGARIASEPSEDLQQNTEGTKTFHAFPNPFVDRTTLQTDSKTSRFRVSLMSADGKVVFEEYYDNPGEGQVELMFGDHLSQGVYLLRVLESSGTAHNIRLLKK